MINENLVYISTRFTIEIITSWFIIFFWLLKMFYMTLSMDWVVKF